MTSCLSAALAWVEKRAPKRADARISQIDLRTESSVCVTEWTTARDTRGRSRERRSNLTPFLAIAIPCPDGALTPSWSVRARRFTDRGGLRSQAPFPGGSRQCGYPILPDDHVQDHHGRHDEPFDELHPVAPDPRCHDASFQGADDV